MNAPAAEGGRAIWPWTLAYALLALPFLPLWPDFEVARRGIGNVLGAVALGLALRTRGDAGLPPQQRALWLGVVALHLVSCAWAENFGDALARGMWLVSLGAIATLAARHSRLRTQLAAVAIVGTGVAAFGLAQGLGLAWPLGYSDPLDPVSTLGNRNVAAEFTALAVVAGAMLLLRARRFVGPAIAVALGVAYLWLNHSRSGLLAAALTVVPLILAPWRPHPVSRRAILLLVVLCGLAAGEGVRGRQGRPAVPHAGAESTPAALSETSRRSGGPPSTIEVRFELWRAALRMLSDTPWLGIGAAQFKVHYPRYRSQREIEISTDGRTFAAAPLTAHNDPLEVAVETGAFGALLYLGFWLSVLRSRQRGGAVALAPVVAFLILGLVRSPLGNAPAAAFAFACVGALCSARPANPRVTPWSHRLFGLGVAGIALVIGGRESAGQWLAAPFLREERKLPSARATLVQVHALDRAVAFCPWDTQLLAMHVALRLHLAKATRDPSGAARALVAPGGPLDTLLRRAPFETTTLLRAASAFAASGDHAATARLLASILAIDPPNPEARLFLATERAQQGDAAGAIVALYDAGAPHARLRAGLAKHFGDLAQITSGTTAQALQHESDFVAAIDALQADRPAADVIQRFALSAERDELRPLVLLALGSLRADDHDTAVKAGERAPADARLERVHARLLATLLPALYRLPAWSRLLPEPK